MKEQILTGDTVLVDVTKLKGYDKNPRKGNVKAIAESLETNKQYRPIVVQKSTNKILAGNHTWRAAKELGWKKIAVVFVDVNDEEAKRIVLADNRTNDLAEYDNKILAELLQDLGTGIGTGYSESDMEAILNATAADADVIYQVSNEAGERVLLDNDEMSVGSSGLGGSIAPNYDQVAFGDEEDEDTNDIEDQGDDLAGVYTLKDDMIFPTSTFWEVPYLRDDMMIEDLPPNLKTWAGSATRDDDHDGYWLYNWGIDSTSGMKDLSKIMLSFYTWDEYFDGWWDSPARHMSKVLNAKIKYAVTPNYSAEDCPKTISLHQIYKSRWVGRYLQEIGVRVMPDLEIPDDKVLIEIAKKTLPKNLKWASIQIQNYSSRSRLGSTMSADDVNNAIEYRKRLVREIDPENLLVYCNPNSFDMAQDMFGSERNVVCMPTRLSLLSTKVKANKEDKSRI